MRQRLFTLGCMRLQFVLPHASVLERIRPARLPALCQLRVTVVQRVNSEPGEVVLQACLELWEHGLVRRVCARVVVDDQLPTDLVVGRVFAERGPPALGARMELAAVAHRLSTVCVERVLRGKVYEERRACLGEAERGVFDGDHIRVDGRLDAMLRERATAERGAAAVEDAYDLLWAVDRTEPVCCTACVQHAMASLYTRAYSKGRRSHAEN